VQYEITTIPTLMVFKGGQVVKKLMGFQKKDTIANALIEAASK
jgi:thioredoxin-like negative regulator of GroEL